MDKIDMIKYISTDLFCKEENQDFEKLLKMKWHNEHECYLTYLFLKLEEQIKILNIKEHHHTKFFLSEIILVIVLAQLRHNMCYKNALKEYYFCFGKYYDYTRFIRKLNEKMPLILNIFKTLSLSSLNLKENETLLIDSFPVEVGKIYREKQLKLKKYIEMKGYNASKKKYFIGLKITILIDLNNQLKFFLISYANEHDSSIFKSLNQQLEEFNISKNIKEIFADSGYLQPFDYLNELDFNLFAQKRKNMKSFSKSENDFIKKIRKPVETYISQVCKKFGYKIHATTLVGFINKINLLLISQFLIETF